MHLHLENKVALVTGGSDGIGASTAQVLADEGAIVYITYFSNEEGAKKVSDSRQDGRIIPIQMDVTNYDQVAEVFKRIAEKEGPVQVLVNNAVAPNWANFNIWNPDIEQFKHMNDTILNGSLYTVSLALADMRKLNWGRIINVSSSVAFVGREGASHYAAGKAGIVGWTRTVAIETAPFNILINCVAPSLVETDRAKQFLNSDYRKEMGQKNPTGRNAAPEDVSRTIAFLASEANSFINGQTISVNGGMF